MLSAFRIVPCSVTSGQCSVTSGVPQGTVLGPLLFLLYINDLPDNVQSSVGLFADDALLYGIVASDADCDLLQSDLRRLESWQYIGKWSSILPNAKLLQSHIRTIHPRENTSSVV